MLKLGSRHTRDWCFKCYFCLVSYVTLVFFIFTISIFIFWLIFLPQDLKFSITDASLTNFNLITNTTTLHYNLSLNISLNNRNKNVGVFYGHIQATAIYAEKRFAVKNISDAFYQGHMSITTIRAVFEGQQDLVLQEEELSRFNLEPCCDNSHRVYNIGVILGLEIMAKYGNIKTGYLKPHNVDCQLKLPLLITSSNKPFNVTECGNVTLPLLWP